MFSLVHFNAFHSMFMHLKAALKKKNTLMQTFRIFTLKRANVMRKEIDQMCNYGTY